MSIEEQREIVEEQRQVCKAKDGIFLEMVDGFQLEFLVHWLKKLDDPRYVRHLPYPKDLVKLLDLLKVADYYEIPQVKD